MIIWRVNVETPELEGFPADLLRVILRDLNLHRFRGIRINSGKDLVVYNLAAM